MAGTIAVKLYELLKGIGVDVSQQQASNVKKLAPKNKSTATKVGLLAAERDTGGNFATVLDIFKKDAQYINSMNDAEQMAFLNNVMDYKEFGGSSIKNTEGIRLKDEFDKGLGTLKDDIESLQSTAKTMKDDAEAGLASAKKDLDDFLTTGGQPLKKKNDKFLGGSMHEEGQIRTGIRQFLQNELKNGRIKLDSMDTERVMKYFPTIEDDPILVFKKIYGDEAYNKAGSFPGAFEIGEDFNHYEKIFRENMGEDILKVKDKKYVGDGTLILTDEVRTPTPDVDDDILFAEGGIADFRIPFASGKVVTSIIEYLTTKFSPMEAMKEVNKVIGKTGKYKNLKLTQKDIDKIVEDTNDFIFQRDPDNLYVKDRPMFKKGDDKKRLLTDDEIRDYEAEIGDSETWMMDGTVEEAEKALKDNKEYIADMKREYDAASPAERAEVIGTKKVNEKFNVDDMSVEDSLTALEGLGGTKIAERFKLKQKYPGLDDDLLTSIIEDTDPMHKASVLAKIDMAMELGKTNKSADEIIEILKSEPETKMATGGRAGFGGGGSVIKLLDGTTVQIPAGSYGKYGLKDHIYSSSKGDLTKDEIVPLLVPSGASYATGGRAGYYGGGQAMVGEDLSQIGHGADALMARNMQLAPNSMATTSTGLNYLLGEDNDTVRVPYKEKGSVTLADLIKVNASGSKSGKNQIMGAPEGITADSETFNAIIKMDIPLSKKIDLLGSYGYGKDRFKVEKGNKELFLGEGGYKDRNIGIGVNQGGEGLSGSVIRNLETGDNDYQLKFLKKFAEGGRIGYNEGLLVPPAKPYTPDMFEKDSMTLLQGMYGTGKDSNEFLYNEMIKKGNILRNQGVERETVIEIIRNNKDKINAFLETQTGDKKTFKGMSDGGIAGIRKGYAGGKGVDIARRGFLKFLGGTAAGVVALKTGLAKMFGKESGAISKKAIDEVIIEGGSGAPAWLQPLVNKALREGTDISKQAVKDGQVVKSLDTPTGKVDVYYDTRTGEIDIDYIGGNTALGESVNMKYVPGVADEGTKGVKPADEFEAVESVPEGKMYSPDDYQVEFGENMTSNIDDLYSDTSELATLGGEKLLVKDISNTLKKKKVLKQMNENPDQFVSDNLPDYDY